MITIIVLLILAGVTIVTLTGDNGLLQKAQTAKEQNEEEKELELIKLAVSAAQIEGKGIITTNNLNNELKSNFNNNKEVNEVEEGWNYKSYTILKEGKVERILPKEYQQVEYIESTGKQWIDSKYSPKCTDGFYIDFFWNDEGNISDPSKQGAIFGCNSPWYLLGNFTGEFYWGGNRILFTLLGYQRHKMSYKNNIFTKGNGDKVEYVGTNDATKNLYIFKANRSEQFLAKASLYSFVIYDLNGNKIKDYIPCYSTRIVIDVDGKECQKGTKGLYDTVEGKFYTNQGEGEFIAGPEV